MPHSPDFEEEVTHADQDMDLKDEMELQIALADPRLVDDDVLLAVVDAFEDCRLVRLWRQADT